MKKIPGVVLAALAIVIALIVVRECGYREGAKHALAAQRDKRDDSTVVALRNESVARAKAFDRERDSTNRVIAKLRSRVPKDTVLRIVSNTPDLRNTQLVLRDTLISALTAGRQQDSLQLVFWQAQVAQRDTVIAQLQASRNAWRQRSERRWFCVGGATVAVGLNGRGAVGPGLTCGYRI